MKGRQRTSALTVSLLAAFTILASTPVAAGAATIDDACGPGAIDFVAGAGFEIATIRSIVVRELGPACEGQVVGARFLGNPEGDPDLPAGVLAQSYSDEDPCTGLDLGVPLVVTDGAITIPLCESSATAGFVDGHDLTDIRLITPAAVGEPQPAPVQPPDPAPATPQTPNPAPADPLEPPATTGADGVMLLSIAGGLLAFGATLLRSGRRRREG